MARILYLHGFASSPSGRKVTALRERLAPEGFELVAPDLNAPSFGALDFESIVERAADAATATDPSLFVGSSLGAMVALALSRRGFSIPIVLIAPALGFGSRWLERLAPGDPILFFHHGEGREIPVHRAFFERMAEVDVDREPPVAPVSVVMGEKDETVPVDVVRAVWERWERSGRLAPGSRFVEISGGDHSLVSPDALDQIAGEARRAEILAAAKG